MIAHVGIFAKRSDGTDLGEFEEREFRDKIFEGDLLPGDYYWRDGMADWRPVSEYRQPLAQTVKIAPMPAPAKHSAAPKNLSPAGAKLCTKCGAIAVPISVTKGSFKVEIILWILLIIPGILYSIWRVISRHSACPKCGAPNMIPLDSPKAQ